MKPIPLGATATVTVVVGDEMTVDFQELGRVHPVYSTYWLAKHMEEASRKLALAYLEGDENGIGHRVETVHHSPALVGMTVEVCATYDAEGSEGNRIAARCRAVTELGDVVGEGATVQVVLPDDVIQRRFDDLRERWRA